MGLFFVAAINGEVSRPANNCIDLRVDREHKIDAEITSARIKTASHCIADVDDHTVS